LILIFKIIYFLTIAGTDTSNYMLRWIILLMANNIEMQKKMREEVERVIGDRMPTHEDKLRCVYVLAFIHECFRYRPVAPLGVLHRAMCDAKLGKSI
jgi:cytochrome P450